MLYLGVDIGGTKCAVSLGSCEADNLILLGKRKFPTNTLVDAVLDECMESIDTLLSEHGLNYSDISGIGISCGGPLDSAKGIVLSPPNLPGWDSVHITEFFEKKTGIAAKLQNDANACAVAEWKFGAGRGKSNVIYLTFGTGLGAGLIIDGRLYAGTSDMAGEVGHIRLAQNGPTGYGKSGSAEGFCSGGGLVQMGKAAVESKKPTLLSQQSEITAEVISMLASQKGDEVCKELYNECARHLGQLLSILIDTLNPEIIILGGIYMRASGLLRNTLIETINSEALEQSRSVCEIVPAGLGEQVGDYAALSVATLINSVTISKNVKNLFEELFVRYEYLGPCKQDIKEAFEILAYAYKTGGKVMVCGNGGSCADSEHIVGELMKSFRTARPLDENFTNKLETLFGESGREISSNLEGGLPTISLCGLPSLSTAFANDRDSQYIYAQQASVLGNEGDVLIAISTSGNAKNCVNAAMTAKAKGMKVAALTGAKESKLSKLADVTIKIPQDEVYLVQEGHLPVYHTLCAMLEEYFFGN